jgi:hypothetical protein
MELVWRFLKELKVKWPYGLTTPGKIPRGIKVSTQQRDIYIPMFIVAIQNNQVIRPA